jgi:hypothetical protein
MKEQLLLWHKFTETQDMTILHELLADDVTFHSPFVWQPKEGKLITSLILKTAASIFENFNYVRAIVSEHDWALEFEANIGELSLRGIDLIKINGEGKITDFEVMIRPANGLQALGIEMGKRLEAVKNKQ